MNTTRADLDVPVSITGLTGQDVTLVFTNKTAANVPFPAIATRSMGMEAFQSRVPSTSTDEDVRTRISEFNRSGWARHAVSAAEGLQRDIFAGPPLAAITYAVGNTRDFYHADGTTRAATLQSQTTTSDGTKVNLWVETTEYAAGRMTPDLVNQLVSKFAQPGGIYDMLKATGGPLWGPHDYSNLIPGTDQPVDIVVLNFNRDRTPYGVVGYFWGLHNLLKTADSRSNESLSLYLDSETLYLDGTEGLQAGLMTMAHEGMHMDNFYRRSVSMGPAYGFDLWLEEMTAMMSEDADSSNIDPTYNSTRDERLPTYLTYLGNGSYNCPLKNWTPYSANGCESYSISGSLGGFLLRQLGVGFYTNLLNQRTPVSETALDSAIKSARANSSLGEQLQRFAVSAIGVLPAASAPPDYGFPARVESGLTIPLIDASERKSILRLPSASPAALAAYGNFPVVRPAVTGTYTETVRVPAGTTLSVVVH